MASITIPAQVFAEDVIREMPGDDVETLERVVSRMERYSDPEASPELDLVRALLEVDLSASESQDWGTPLRAMGLDSWVSIVERLRITNEPGFCVVLDAPMIDNGWEHFSDDTIVEAKNAPDWEGQRFPPLYTLPLEFTIGPHERVEVPQLGSCVEPSPVRPYPADAKDAAAIQALAAHLEPRIARAFGGARRVREEPILAPICALAATLWVAVTHPRMRTVFRRTERYRFDALCVALDALDLDTHTETALRLLVRNHPRHIHVDASQAPAGYRADEWYDGLGMFALANEGHLDLVTPATRRGFSPRILTSLAGPEPF